MYHYHEKSFTARSVFLPSVNVIFCWIFKESYSYDHALIVSIFILFSARLSMTLSLYKGQGHNQGNCPGFGKEFQPCNTKVSLIDVVYFFLVTQEGGGQILS